SRGAVALDALRPVPERAGRRGRAAHASPRMSRSTAPPPGRPVIRLTDRVTPGGLPSEVAPPISAARVGAPARVPVRARGRVRLPPGPEAAGRARRADGAADDGPSAPGRRPSLRDGRLPLPLPLPPPSALSARRGWRRGGATDSDAE